MSGPSPEGDGPGLRELVEDITRRLAVAGCASPRCEATQLVAGVLEVELGEVHRLALLGRRLPPDLCTPLEGWVARREAREPLQHVLGRAHFAGLELEVGPGVFVPRPETELLAERAAERVEEWATAEGPGPRPALELVDLCTGSGALVLGIAQRVQDRGRVPGDREIRLHAAEIDPVAAGFARRNAKRSGFTVDLRVRDAVGSFPELQGAVDLVVSNPPYVPVGAVPRDPEVREHDPDLALYGGSEDGLALPLALVDWAHRLLRPGGVLLMEHDDTQGESLPSALQDRGWAGVRDHRDLAGRPRFVEAVRS